MENPEINLIIEEPQEAEIDMQVSAGETVAAPVDASLLIEGMAADAKAAGDAIRQNAQDIQALESAMAGKVAKPETSPNGTDGQLLQTNGDGTTQWVDQGTPTDAQVGEAVDAWLEDHPEATTTVEDGAISRAKLDADLKGKTDAIPDNTARITVLEDIIGNSQGLTPEQLSTIAAGGHADKYFSVGDIITIPWTDRSGETDVEYQVPFVVADIADAYDSNAVKHEKAIWLQALRTIPQEMIFHAADRTEVDLTTETVAVSGWAYVGQSGSTFTALNLSAGDPIPTTYDHVYKTTYTGIALAAVQNGVARWKDSDIRQWLNSTAAKNENWWTSQYDGATPPAAEYTNLPGFLGGFSADWQAVFKAPKVTVSLSLDGGTTIIDDYTYDKVFLPSKAGVYASSNQVGDPYWAYWVSAVGTNSPRADSSAARVLTALDGNTAVTWYLRKNHNATTMDEASYIKTNGGMSYSIAKAVRRAAPCVCMF